MKKGDPLKKEAHHTLCIIDLLDQQAPHPTWLAPSHLPPRGRLFTVHYTSLRYIILLWSHKTIRVTNTNLRLVMI